MRKVLVGVVKEIKYEDGKQSAQFEIGSHDGSKLFVRVQSWAENKLHHELEAFKGKEVAIIIDTIGRE